MTPSRNIFCTRTAAALAAGVIAIAGLSGAALGQIGLSDSVINPTSGQLGAEDKDQIKKLIDANKAGLSGDEDAVMASRRVLLRPLQASTVSQVFRIEYSQQLLPIVKPLMADKKDEVAINATRIAGELATRDGLQALAGPLKDPRPAVRVMAAMGYERTFTTVRTGQPAIIARDATVALKELESAFQAETDARVADTIIIAMDAAMRIDASVLSGVRVDAVKTLSGAVAAKARDPKNLTFLAAFARATDSLYDAVNDPNPGSALASDSVKEAAAVAGDMIAIALRQSAGTPPEGDALRQMRQVLKQAENLYDFSHRKVAGSKPARRELSESFGTDNAKFRRDAIEVISVLTNPSGPFKLPSERFPR